MINLLTSPPRVSYSNSEISVLVATDNINSPVAATITFTFSAAGPLDGEILVLHWLSYTIRLFFAAAPDDSGYEMPIIGTGSLGDYITNLWKALRKNNVLSENFVIEKTDTEIIFTHKKAVNRLLVYADSVPTDLSISSTDGIELFKHENLSAYLHVLNEYGERMGVPMNIPFDAVTKWAKFDLQSAFKKLKSHLPNISTLLPNSGFIVGNALDAYQVFSFEMAEKYGNPSVVRQLVHSRSFAVVNGNMPEFPNHTDEPVEVLHSFLLRKKVTTRQPEYAYIWAKKNIEKLLIEVIVRLDNGETFLYYPINPYFFPFLKNTLSYFQLGFEQLGLHTLNLAAERRIVAYDWRILQPGYNANTELVKRSFEVDYRASDRDLYLLCDNGMGGCDTICLSGAVREKRSSEFSSYLDADGNAGTYAETVTTSYEVVTGVMLTETARYTALLLRGSFWLVDLKKRAFRPCVRVTKDIEINPNVPYNALKFSFEIAEKQR